MIHWRQGRMNFLGYFTGFPAWFICNCHELMIKINFVLCMPARIDECTIEYRSRLRGTSEGRDVGYSNILKIKRQQARGMDAQTETSGLKTRARKRALRHGTERGSGQSRHSPDWLYFRDLYDCMIDYLFITLSSNYFQLPNFSILTFSHLTDLY